MPEPIAQTDLSEIAKRIVVVRGQRVLLDVDLASLYGVTPKRLNEQVRRNLERFPSDFLITLEINELRNLRSQFATSSWGGRRYRVLAFTEHGAFMAANVLNSQRATEMSIYVVRAFVKLREILASNEKLARKLRELEKSLTTLDVKTRRQFEEVYAAFRALMAPPAAKSRPIGFTADLDREP
jgi:phage regulator Rha-like protein